MRTPTTRSRALTAAASTAALAGALAGGLVGASPASAAPSVEVLAGGLVGPLSLAVGDDGTRWITEDFTGTLYRQAPGEDPVPVFHAGGGQEVAGVSVEGSRGRFALSDQNLTTGRVMEIRPGGGVRKLFDSHAYEYTVNPDGSTKYGFERISPRCAAQLPPEMGPATYTGITDSHPYGTALVDGVTYLADAGGNDLVAIEPGGPEDPSLGANGRVLKINPANGKVKTVATGLLSVTGVAVAPNGDVYASQLFAGSIVRIPAGTNTPEPFVDVPLPADVDVASDGVYATVNVLPGESGPPDGQLVRITEAE
jgi:streptogramin lyase